MPGWIYLPLLGKSFPRSRWWCVWKELDYLFQENKFEAWDFWLSGLWNFNAGRPFLEGRFGSKEPYSRFYCATRRGRM